MHVLKFATGMHIEARTEIETEMHIKPDIGIVTVMHIKGRY